jgi:hypothetical protein
MTAKSLGVGVPGDAAIDIARIRAEYGDGPGAADRFLFDFAHAMVKRTSERMAVYEEQLTALAIAIDRCSPARFAALRPRLHARALQADAMCTELLAWVRIAEQCARKLGVTP